VTHRALTEEDGSRRQACGGNRHRLHRLSDDPELALEAGHVTVLQRTAQWVFPVPGYRSPFLPQVNWLDRNLPYYTNFMRAQVSNSDWFSRLTEVDPDYDDLYACNPNNKMARDACVAFLQSKLDDPDLVATMTRRTRSGRRAR